jgi:propanediol dehydratase small subunit
MPITIADPGRPRFGKIPAAVKYSGRSRGRLYQLATAHPGLFKKDGSSTLVDFAVLDQILDALPAADIRIGTRGPREKPQPQQPQRRRRRKVA